MNGAERLRRLHHRTGDFAGDRGETVRLRAIERARPQTGQ
jgi:hypothetical protein